MAFRIPQTYQRIFRNRSGVNSSNLTESLTGFLSGPCSPTRKRPLQTRSSNEDRINWYQSFSFFLLDLTIFHFSFSDFSFFVLVWFLNLFIVLEPLLNFKCVYVSLFASSVEKKKGGKFRPIQKKLPTITINKREKKNMRFVFLLVLELSVIVFVLGSLILLSLSNFCLGFRIVDSYYCFCVDLEFLNLALDFS